MNHKCVICKSNLELLIEIPHGPTIIGGSTKVTTLYYCPKCNLVYAGID